MFKYIDHFSYPVYLLSDTIFNKHWTASVSFIFTQTKAYQQTETLTKVPNPFEEFWPVHLQSSAENWRCCYCCSSCVFSFFLQSVSYKYGILFIWAWDAMTSVLSSLSLKFTLLWVSVLWENLPSEDFIHLRSCNSWVRNFSWTLLLRYLASRLVSEQLEPSWLVVAAAENVLHESSALKCYIYHVRWALSLLSGSDSSAVNPVNL